jgi:hypothetical protein
MKYSTMIILFAFLISGCKKVCPCEYGHTYKVTGVSYINGQPYQYTSEAFTCDSRPAVCADSLMSIWY